MTAYIIFIENPHTKNLQYKVHVFKTFNTNNYKDGGGRRRQERLGRRDKDESVSAEEDDR